MTSFARVELKWVSVIGLALVTAHLALQGPFPQLSPHYKYERPLWMRAMVTGEYITVLLALVVAVSQVASAISRRNTKPLSAMGLVLAGGLLAAFLYVFR